MLVVKFLMLSRCLDFFLVDGVVDFRHKTSKAALKVSVVLVVESSFNLVSLLVILSR